MQQHMPTILIVEDNPEFLELTAKLLSGYACHTARTAAQGEDLYRQHKQDIVFLDITLPDSSGHDLLKKIKSVREDAYVIMLTGSSAGKDVAQAAEQGVASYILKPLTRKSAKDCLDRYYRKCKEDANNKQQAKG